MSAAIRSQIDLPSPRPTLARWPMSPGIVFSLIPSTRVAAFVPTVTSAFTLSTFDCCRRDSNAQPSVVASGAWTVRFQDGRLGFEYYCEAYRPCVLPYQLRHLEGVSVVNLVGVAVGTDGVHLRTAHLPVPVQIAVAYSH